MLGRLAGEGVEWIQLAQDRDTWWAVVNTVMNLRVLVPGSLLLSWYNVRKHDAQLQLLIFLSKI
jgi:hypothetical protein